jgi:hypothetical protein
MLAPTAIVAAENDPRGDSGDRLVSLGTGYLVVRPRTSVTHVAHMLNTISNSVVHARASPPTVDKDSLESEA